MRFESLRRRDPIRWLTITAVFMAMNIALLVPVLAVVTVHSDAEGTDRNLGLGVLQLGGGAQPAHHDSAIQHNKVLLLYSGFDVQYLPAYGNGNRIPEWIKKIPFQAVYILAEQPFSGWFPAPVCMFYNRQTFFLITKGKGNYFPLPVQAKEYVIVRIAFIHDMCVSISLWCSRKALGVVDTVLPGI